MARRLLALAAAAFALGACDRLSSQATPEADYRPEEAGTVDHALCLLGFRGVPLRELMTGHHLVEAELNGRKGVFILDTGANASVLHAPHAARFGVGEGLTAPAAAVGLGGAMKARQARLETLSIGGIAIRQSRIMTADLAQIEQMLGRISGETLSGIIGQDVMKEHRAVIDVDGPILYLMEQDRDPAPVPAERCRRADEPGAKGKKKA
jgi:hypothetical protein